MKKIVSLMVMLLLISAVSVLIADSAIADDEAKIRRAALDYIEGFYTGDAARMEQALHPEFHKIGLRVMEKTGKSWLPGAGFSKMVELTRLGIGKQTPAEKRNISVHILEIGKDIASAKTVSCDYIDHLHLARFNGEWKIINALWEPNPHKKPGEK